MTSPHATTELFDLLYDLAEHRLSPERTARLEELLLADPANRAIYVEFMLVVGGLHRIRGAGAARNDECRTMNDELPARAHPVTTGPAVNHSSFIIHHSSFFSGALLSYAVSLLLLAVAVLGAWKWQASSDRGVGQIATGLYRMAKPVGHENAVAPAGTVVAKITQITGGDWGDQLAVGMEVPMDYYFALSDGLVEITYNNGARVMLQGPVIFVVDSPDGGFLLLGKIGALAVNPPAVDGREGQKPGNLPPAALSRQSFSIRTPSAAVTSPGAEISVRVERSGASELYVFRGGVYLDSPHREETLALGERSWAFTEIKADGTGLVTYSLGQPPATLAKRMPWRRQEAYSMSERRAERQDSLPQDDKKKGREDRRGT